MSTDQLLGLLVSLAGTTAWLLIAVAMKRWWVWLLTSLTVVSVLISEFIAFQDPAAVNTQEWQEMFQRIRPFMIWTSVAIAPLTLYFGIWMYQNRDRLRDQEHQ